MGEKKVDRFLFKLSDKLGEGSYGQVFKGHDEKNKEIVAIKMLNKALINEDEYLREGLMNEIKIMRDLTGNNVVRLIDVLETTNNYYIVQEYCDGGDLQHLLKKRKFLPQKDAILFFVDVLLGMMELVKKGIIHRDLKPANILISKNVYKIADFGFSKAVDNFSKQMLTSNVGTPLYQSPQLLKGDKYTSKSDVWSLGFIFYEILYGQTPWTGRSIPELIKNIYHQPLNFPAEKNIDPQYISMLKGCLELEEKGRFGWDQLYRHPCFGNSFKFYTDQAKQLEDKAMFLVQDLRFKVMKDKIDLEKVFIKYDKSGDNSLDIKEMTVLLHEIDPKLEREEIEFIFNKIDLDGSNSIELTEFKKWLEENQVQMSMKKNTGQGLQRRGTQEIAQIKPNQSEQEIPNFSSQFDANKMSQKLPNQQQSQQVQQFYNQQSQQFQGNSPQVMGSPQVVTPPVQMNQFNQSGSYNQYTYPQNQQYPPPNQQYPPPQNQYSQQYSQQYPQQSYPQFQNMQGSQSQQQFQYQQQQSQPYAGMNNSQNHYYNYQAPPPYQPSPYQQPVVQPTASQQLASERAMITIQKLVIAIEKYNINIMELFRKYDKSDSQSLDVKEFGIMLRKIDNSLTDQDINQAFWLFDKDKSGEISFKEFKDGIEEHIRRWKLLNQQQIYTH